MKDREEIYHLVARILENHTISEVEAMLADAQFLMKNNKVGKEKMNFIKSIVDRNIKVKVESTKEFTVREEIAEMVKNGEMSEKEANLALSELEESK